MASSLVLSLALLSSPALAAPVERRTAGRLVLEDVPAIPPELAERMLQYQNTRAASLNDFSPDGDGLLMTTRFGETAQLHWLKAPGGARRQLTFFKEPVSGAALSPKRGARELVLSMDSGGSENHQLYLFRLDEAKARLLTDGKSRNQSALWSRRGDRLVFNGTERNGKDFDFHAVDPASGARRLLKQVDGYWGALDWSPDDSKLLVRHFVSANESYLHVLDARTGAVEPLFPPREGEKIAYGTARWAGPGAVLFTSDEAGEFTRLGRLDLTTREVRWLSAGLPWNVESLAVSLDGKRAAFVANEDGAGRLYLGPAAGPFARVEGLPLGVVHGPSFSHDGRTVGFALDTARSPGDIYAVDWAERRPVRWTESETGGLPASAFVEPELIRYPTFDSVEGATRAIPALYYRPRGKGPFPVVVSIHGGPEAQVRPGFNPTFQYWLNELGIAVLAPNVRGSDGYGKSYLLLDNGFKREDSVKDIGALLDWAASRPELDASRVGVSGGSYGGYMSLAALAHYPGRLRAGVDIVGISNFNTFLKNTKDYRRDPRRAEYGDERDPAMAAHLEAISPTTIAGRIRAPLFVIQGQNDPRVPASEAEQIVSAVRGQGTPVWYLLALDEGHGFAKKTNRDFMGQAVSLFWQRHLLAPQPSESAPARR